MKAQERRLMKRKNQLFRTILEMDNLLKIQRNRILTKKKIRSRWKNHHKKKIEMSFKDKKQKRKTKINKHKTHRKKVKLRKKTIKHLKTPKY